MPAQPHRMLQSHGSAFWSSGLALRFGIRVGVGVRVRVRVRVRVQVRVLVMMIERLRVSVT